MNISEFFRKDVCDYASYDNYRKLGSMCDSFKPSARKCIYTANKHNLTSPIKVATLTSDVVRDTEYLHGQTSLEGVLVGLAQNFPGSNNIPLLKREGTFGNRLVQAAAASRYIFTCKEEYLDKIFRKEDDPILIEQVFEGKVIEPKFYMPIIPMLLVNGSIGLTTGFTQKILSRNVNDCIKYIEAKLDGKKSLPEIIPYFNGFTGDVSHNKEKGEGSWVITGKYKKISGNEIEITEIPIGYSLEDYVEVLDSLEDEKLIKDYRDLSDDGKFRFIVKFFRNDQGLNIDDKNLMTKLKLVSLVTENYTSLDENNKVVEYKSIYEIFDHYYDIRLEYYDKRKNYQINSITKKIYELISKYTFVSGVVKGDIVISKKTDEQITKQLEKYDKIIKIDDSYDYLVNMPIRSLTKEQIEKLANQIKDAKTLLDDLKKTSNKDMWKKDLDDFRKGFKG